MNSFDLKIIRCLMGNARTTWAELGTLLGLTAPAAADRVRRLEERGVIKGYAAIVDPEAVGCLVTAYISVTLAKPADRKDFLTQIAALPQVQECHHIAGDYDYLLKIRNHTLRELETFVSEALKEIPGVVKTHTTIVMSTLKETPVLPVWAEPGTER